MNAQPRLIPELDVSSLADSLHFYVQVLGFAVIYERPEEAFAMLERDGAQLMLQEAAGPGRRFTQAELVRPYGRGVNFQIQVSSAQDLYTTVLAQDCNVIIELEEHWYRSGEQEVGNRQFVVADPDGTC